MQSLELGVARSRWLYGCDWCDPMDGDACILSIYVRLPLHRLYLTMRQCFIQDARGSFQDGPKSIRKQKCNTLDFTPESTFGEVKVRRVEQVDADIAIKSNDRLAGSNGK